jgi:ParB/RepB/Spo0J family partition protein
MSASPDSDPTRDTRARFRELRDVAVADVDRGANPRIHFTEEELERLAESVAKEGILVPVVVYPKDGRFRLIDGERRWLTAQTLGLDTIPAVITDPPDARENLVRMFNIHQVREPWADMPTAWAIKELIEETGPLDARELADLTGLSTERIERLRHAVELPRAYQEYIDRGLVPLNFFWELKKNVIEPLAARRPSITEEFGADQITTAFVQKRLARVITDTISLRKVAAIIRVAAQEAGDQPRAESALDGPIRELLTDQSMTIVEAYEDTVVLTIESDKLERRFGNLVRSLERLIGKAETEEERARLNALARDHIDRLQRLLE